MSSAKGNSIGSKKTAQRIENNMSDGGKKNEEDVKFNKVFHCIKCRKLTGKTKYTISIEDVKEYEKFVKKEVKVGDTVCQKCIKGKRSSENLQKWRMKKREENERLDKKKSGDTSSNTDDESSKDEDFLIKKSIEKSESNGKFTKVPIKCTLATAQDCFLCKSTSSVIRVPLEARKQVFEVKKIFIPRSNKVCSKHLQNKCFIEEELENIAVHANTSELDDKDLDLFWNQSKLQEVDLPAKKRKIKI